MKACLCAMFVCPSANTTSEQWSKSVSAVLQSHGVDAAKGLSTTQVEKLRKEHGPNELDKEEGTPLWKVSCTLFRALSACLPCAACGFVLCLAFGMSTLRARNALRHMRVHEMQRAAC